MKTLSKLFIVALLAALPVRAEQTEYGKLNTQAVKLYSESKFDEAIAAGEEALKLGEQTLAPDDKDLLTILENLASIYGGAKQPDKAKATHERILAFKEKDSTSTPTSKANTLFSLGDLELDQKNWDDATGYYRRCLEIRETALGPDHADTILAVDRIAWVLQNEKKFAEAFPLLERVAAAREKVTPPNAANLGTSYNNLGYVADQLKKTADVERYYKRALELRRQAPGDKDANLIASLYALANFYRLQEKMKSAEPYYKELLPLEEKNLGKENLELLPTLKGYAEVVGPDGLQKKNTADVLKKRIKHLEELEDKKDESKKGK